MTDFKFDDFENSQGVGLDAFFEGEPEVVSLTKGASQPTKDDWKVVAARPKKARRVKVGSLSQLKGFERVAEDTLINKATQELWSISKSDNGDFYVQRLFQDDGSPLKG